MKQKVLITGIDGFTGKHLSQYLIKAGYEVYGTSLKKESKNIFICDITKKDDIKEVLKKVNPDYIIHLAAISFVGHQNYQEFYKINVIGTENLLESTVDIQKIIVASSATVYGNQNSEILDENMCPNPNNHYAISKLATEQIAKNYFDKYPVIITRPFNYTGIGQSEIFLIPKIIKHYKEKKKVIELGNLDVIREFNDIEFVCEGYKRLLEKEIKSEIVNIASSRGIKLMDIIKYMNEISGYEIEVKVNPKFIRKNEIKKLIGSNKKLFGIIGEVKQKEFKKVLKEMYENSY